MLNILVYLCTGSCLEIVKSDSIILFLFVVVNCVLYFVLLWWGECKIFMKSVMSNLKHRDIRMDLHSYLCHLLSLCQLSKSGV